MTRTVLLLLALLAAPRLAYTQHTVLLELFTSEGCSSCPPADALLRQLNGTHTSQGDLFVALSEHVTYWNSLGWHDPFSTDVSTERQNAYGRRFHQQEVYTPQMVVNGERQVLGSDRSAVLYAAQEAHHPGASLKIASVDREGNHLAVAYNLSGDLPSAPVDIYAAIAEDEVMSSVPRGENGGRTLTHVSVASSLVKVASLAAPARGTFHVPLPPVPASINGSRRHLILFAQSSGLGPVLAVDSAPLSPLTNPH